MRNHGSSCAWTELRVSCARIPDRWCAFTNAPSAQGFLTIINFLRSVVPHNHTTAATVLGYYQGDVKPFATMSVPRVDFSRRGRISWYSSESYHAWNAVIDGNSRMTVRRCSIAPLLLPVLHRRRQLVPDGTRWLE